MLFLHKRNSHARSLSYRFQNQRLQFLLVRPSPEGGSGRQKNNSNLAPFNNGKCETPAMSFWPSALRPGQALSWRVFTAIQIRRIERLFWVGVQHFGLTWLN